MTLKALLAFSFSPGFRSGGRVPADVLAASGRILATFAEQPARAVFDSGCEHVLVTDGGDSAHTTAVNGFAVLLRRGAYTSDGASVDENLLLARMASEDAMLSRFAPPFAACWSLGPGQPVMAATDALGLRHLYWCQGDGWAALATSSLVLAAVIGAELDEAAVGRLALVGYQLGEQPAFQGVRELGPGQWCRLQNGRLERSTYVRSVHDATDSHRSFDRAVEDGRQTLAGAVAAAMASHPGAAIELSGGMDCRAVLAAIPPAARRGMDAYTLGVPDSADHRVACLIADRWRMHHHFVDTRHLADLRPDDAFALVERAGRWRDFGVDPLASAALEWVEAKIDQGPRFTGQGGELYRGEYYPGQRPHDQVTPSLVERLASWRLFTNQPVDTALFAAEFLADGRSDALRAVRIALGDVEDGWLRACDELYLRVRMRHWTGRDFSRASVSRIILAPYFDAQMIAWGRRAAPSDKRRSRLFNAVLEQLDAELASIPLDTGVTPRALARLGMTTRARLASDSGRKLLTKVRQRVQRRGRTPIGVPALAALVRRHWLEIDDPLRRVQELAFIDASAVREIACGRRSVDAATVAFLAGLDGAVSFVSREHRTKA